MSSGNSVDPSSGRLPVAGSEAQRSDSSVERGSAFDGSASYWEQRYLNGGTSGPGSYGRLAAFKAEILNEFVRSADIEFVIELGCGDGNQLSLAEYPKYVGLDVSARAVDMCRKRFASDGSKSFYEMREYPGEAAECTISLDVILHLVEDPVFHDYMTCLFDLSTDHVVIYSSNSNDAPWESADHVRHRNFTEWVEEHAPEFELASVVPNRYPKDPTTGEGSFADFYFYRRIELPDPHG